LKESTEIKTNSSQLINIKITLASIEQKEASSKTNKARQQIVCPNWFGKKRTKFNRLANQRTESVIN
jgi:hypothetical protein